MTCHIKNKITSLEKNLVKLFSKFGLDTPYVGVTQS
jgi:hypothetical protein